MARVPWCGSCDRFLSPSSVVADGSCPACGQAVDPGRAHAGAPAVTDEDAPLEPLPWHFKLLAGAVALYLGYRAFQGIEWLAGRL